MKDLIISWLGGFTEEEVNRIEKNLIKENERIYRKLFEANERLNYNTTKRIRFKKK